MYFPELGGVEAVTKVIAEIISQSEEVKVLTFNSNNELKEEVINKVKVIRLPSYLSRGSIRLSRSYKNKFSSIVKSARTVIFHFPSGQPEIYASTYKKITAEKICFYHADLVGHGLLGFFYNKIFVNRFLKSMNKIIVTSPNIAGTSKILKKYHKKIEVIPLFVDVSHFYPKSSNKRNLLVSKLKALNNDRTKYKMKRIIMYLGRLSHYKGLEYLIKAVMFLDNSYRLVIIGEGPLKKKLEKLADRLEVRSRTLFLNHVPYEELPEYYSAADVFVLPSISRAEAFGLVGLEAMACGTPVITTELGTGTSYYNIDGQTGLVVPPKDPKALAEAIRTICESDWKSRKKNIIIERAKEFSIDDFKQRILEVLK
jgi:glycosyltransferase involved in cell wall biosynthesis